MFVDVITWYSCSRRPNSDDGSFGHSTTQTRYKVARVFRSTFFPVGRTLGFLQHGESPLFHTPPLFDDDGPLGSPHPLPIWGSLFYFSRTSLRPDPSPPTPCSTGLQVCLVFDTSSDLRSLILLYSCEYTTRPLRALPLTPCSTGLQVCLGLHTPSDLGFLGLLHSYESVTRPPYTLSCNPTSHSVSVTYFSQPTGESQP